MSKMREFFDKSNVAERARKSYVVRKHFQIRKARMVARIFQEGCPIAVGPASLVVVFQPSEQQNRPRTTPSTGLQTTPL